MIWNEAWYEQNHKRAMEKQSTKVVIGDRVYKSINDAALKLGCSGGTISKALKAGKDTVVVRFGEKAGTYSLKRYEI